ncbi:MAG TPA: hypothetical protein ENK39_08760 [Epsilonproteobacteria bacterium]|nr:hypothetical protein [Campylobacterota bacterium]
MKEWKELSRLQKILLGFLIIGIVLLIPEASFLVDVGGVDLILFFLLMYSQNIKMWFENTINVFSYPSMDNKTFVVRTTATSLFFWLSGSLLFSYGVFLVLMFVKGNCVYC